MRRAPLAPCAVTLLGALLWLRFWRFLVSCTAGRSSRANTMSPRPVAPHRYSVADGAKWIARQYHKQLPMLDEHILDWYHFQEHVVETSHALYGETNPQAGAWQQKMLEAAWAQGSLVMLHRLGPYERRHTGENREALGALRQYVESRTSMTDYPRFVEQGTIAGRGRPRASAARRPPGSRVRACAGTPTTPKRCWPWPRWTTASSGPTTGNSNAPPDSPPPNHVAHSGREIHALHLTWRHTQSSVSAIFADGKRGMFYGRRESGRSANDQ